jgi:hypothetical protein
MAKIPPFVYTSYNNNHFITDTRLGITTQVYAFNNPEEAKAHRLYIIGKSQSTQKPVYYASLHFRGTWFEITTVRFAIQPDYQNPQLIQKIEKTVTRMADWFLHAILREDKMQ